MGPNPPPLPDPGWYLDPLDADQLRWWDGVRWTAAAAPKPRELRGRALAVLVVGVSLLGVNALISVPIFLLLALFAGSGTAFIAACAAGGAFVVAILAASIRGSVRSRMTALGGAVAIAVVVWVFMLVWFPNRPKPRLSQLRRDPAAQLIYPGAVVAFTSGRDSKRGLGGEPIGSSIARIEATDATPDQAIAWFDQQLTSMGWTRDDSAVPSQGDPRLVQRAWRRISRNGPEVFSLTLTPAADVPNEVQQYSALRGVPFVLSTDLRGDPA